MKKNKSIQLTRRDAIRQGLASTAALTMGAAAPRLFAEPKKAMPAVKAAAKATSVIQIWMWGGPCHLDTFDPKPDAGKDYCGPYDKPIATNADGVRIGQMLPQLARQADKYSIIRSMTHGINGHETASYRVQTGHEPGRLVYPSAGAVVSLFKGYQQGYKGIVPPYIVLTQPQGRFSEAGFLGVRHKPFSTGGDPSKDPFAVEGIIAKGLSDTRQQRRRELLGTLDTLGESMEGNPAFSRFNQCQDEAYDMMLGKARELFDLTKESDPMRERYGRNTFGQSCLMARRLVEQGVPYVTINYKGWDTHKQHFTTMNRKLPEMDQAMAALLGDLSSRGLLDSTIIWWGGEFGRSPKVQWAAPWNGGRSHFGKCFCSVLAGGGFQGGRIVGASDDKGVAVKDRPVYPEELLASLYHQLGIDPAGALPNPKGLDLKVMPLGEGRKLLTEIM